MDKGQAERLFPMLEEMLSEAGLQWRDLTALAVGIGPGNFTGVRMAVSAARGLALSLGIPAHGVSVLEALAFGQEGPTLAVLDARKEQAYSQLFGTPAPHPAALSELGEIQDLLGNQHARLTIVGDFSEQIARMLGAQAAPSKLPLPVAMAMIAQTRSAPADRPSPLYLRPADAAPSRDLPPVILP